MTTPAPDLMDALKRSLAEARARREGASRSRRFDQCSETCTADCRHCKGRPVAALRAELDEVRAKARFAIDEAIKLGEAQLVVIDQRDQAKAEVERLRAELSRWESGQRRKGLPPVESVPDGITTAARLARAIGTEGGEEHDNLLAYAAQQLKAACGAASCLLAEKTAVEFERNALRRLAAEMLSHFTQKGHPGKPCARTDWVPEEIIVKWHQTYREMS